MRRTRCVTGWARDPFKLFSQDKVEVINSCATMFVSVTGDRRVAHSGITREHCKQQLQEHKVRRATALSDVAQVPHWQDFS
jgi:hypothetical protein